MSAVSYKRAIIDARAEKNTAFSLKKRCFYVLWDYFAWSTEYMCSMRSRTFWL